MPEPEPTPPPFMENLAQHVTVTAHRTAAGQTLIITHPFYGGELWLSVGDDPAADLAAQAIALHRKATELRGRAELIEAAALRLRRGEARLERAAMAKAHRIAKGLPLSIEPADNGGHWVVCSLPQGTEDPMDGNHHCRNWREVADAAQAYADRLWKPQGRRPKHA